MTVLCQGGKEGREDKDDGREDEGKGRIEGRGRVKGVRKGRQEKGEEVRGEEEP